MGDVFSRPLLLWGGVRDVLTGPDTAIDEPRRTTILGKEDVPTKARPLLKKTLSIDWLGQTIASLCWIGSVLSYGLNSSGDWLQLFAATSWLLANITAVKND